MKGYLFITAIACVLPFMASAQNDIYYIPSQEVQEVTVKKATQTTVSPIDRTARYYDENRNVDEYNRRGRNNHADRGQLLLFKAHCTLPRSCRRSYREQSILLGRMLR